MENSVIDVDKYSVVDNRTGKKLTKEEVGILNEYLDLMIKKDVHEKLYSNLMGISLDKLNSTQLKA